MITTRPLLGTDLISWPLMDCFSSGLYVQGGRALFVVRPMLRTGGRREVYNAALITTGRCKSSATINETERNGNLHHCMSFSDTFVDFQKETKSSHTIHIIRQILQIPLHQLICTLPVDQTSKKRTRRFQYKDSSLRSFDDSVCNNDWSTCSLACRAEAKREAKIRNT